MLLRINPRSLIATSCLLTAVFFAAHWAADIVVAAPGEAANIELFDQNSDGYVDTVKLYIDDPGEETWVLEGGAPYGFSLSRGGQDVSINNVSIDTSHGEFPGQAVVTIDVDTADTDLLDAKDTSAQAIELVYTQAGGGAACTTCVHGATAQLEEIPIGDGGDRNTEYDLAPPLLESATTRNDEGAGGYVDHVEITFTETVTVGNGESSTSGMFTALGTTCTLDAQDAGDASNVTSLSIPVNADVPDTDCKATVTYTGENTIYGSTGGPPMNADTSTVTSFDGAVPAVLTQTTDDVNHDGHIDRLTVTFSEPVWVNDGEVDVEERIAFYGSACTPAIVYGDYDLAGVESAVFTLSTPETDTSCTVSMEFTDAAAANDEVSNDIYLGTSGDAYDGAAPVVLSVTPAIDAGDVALDALVGATFSEEVAPTFVYDTQFAANPDPGGWSTDWLSIYENTLTHDPFAEGTTYTITFAPSEILDITGNALVMAGFTDDGWSFTTVGGGEEEGGGGGGGGGSPTPVSPLFATSVTLISPNGGTSYPPGTPVRIAWRVSDMGRADYVDLDWSADNGLTWMSVAKRVPAVPASYLWAVPDVLTDRALVRVQTTDSVVPMVMDESNAPFSVVAAGRVSPEEPKVAYPRMGAGTLLKARGLPTVYLVTEEGERRPFLHEREYFTWYKDFSSVTELPLPEMIRYRMGAAMSPKPGTVLVKSRDNPQTYWVGPDEVLRPVPSEASAARLLGADWSKKVIDMYDVYFGNASYGAPML